MTANPKHRFVFKRVERDDEFKKRLRDRASPRVLYIDFLALTGLDEWAWSEYKMQRRIVEDVA